MTIGSENLNNGSSTAQDRFSGGVSAYRQGRREALHADLGDGELLSRGGSGLPTRSPGRSHHALEPTTALDRAAKLPSLDLQGLADPVLPATWGDGNNTSMADHPLLRGLLLELPARGTLPQSDWLDRWFEAARSILELLYVQEAKKHTDDSWRGAAS
ncbi:hypothetical protein [Actinoplanes siamensis]|uniref:Uncharacterized protein n=1 Tax=Actinoplanes siamensis TaxID=1223317 RepID=A0A919NF93_9ACTN|nr:hypothetical protein [Actinoplanes siamensis]GIF09614.1 hypothetical protein Asi03nite_71520 [Actinoplanes siamensis]